jgi:hypothetical protein
MSTAHALSTEDVAHELTSLCRKGEFREAMESLYAPSIISVEPRDMPNLPRETRGLEGCRQKAQWWETNHTVHSCTITGPFLSKDKFAVVFNIDATDKPSGKRNKMTELGVYSVADGKITREEFFYQAS